MKGIQKVIIQDRRMKYEFELRRNLTILRGDSATGKTTLIEMVQEYINNPESGIQLQCDKQCYVLSGSTWQAQLGVMQDSIVFMDEGNTFVMSDEFARSIRETDNYYVIVTREGLPNLPYSVEEIYGIRTSGKYGGLQQTYHEFYRIYGDETPFESFVPATVITEDSNSGHQFIDGLCTKATCISANGKSNISKIVTEQGEENAVLIIADGAAFGAEMDTLMKYINSHPTVKLYLPESFEWLVLKSGVVPAPELQSVLERPSDFIESAEYFSWERYFTHVLTEATQNTYLHYSKSALNEAYLQGSVKDAIVSEIPKIKFE